MRLNPGENGRTPGANDLENITSGKWSCYSYSVVYSLANSAPLRDAPFDLTPRRKARKGLEQPLRRRNELAGHNSRGENNGRYSSLPPPERLPLFHGVSHASHQD